MPISDLREWARSSVESLWEKLRTSAQGLSDEDVQQRLELYGTNEPVRKKKRTLLLYLLAQFQNPLVIVLTIIGAFSYYLQEPVEAAFIFFMVLISVGLTFIQEYRSSREVEKLIEVVRTTATVCRHGRFKEVHIRELVPGDVVNLSAGDMIPADVRIFSCKDLFINQGTLTGESFPVEKTAQPLLVPGATLSELTNLAFMGSNVVSGTALGVVLKTGLATEFGEITRKLAVLKEKTSFEKGIRGFTWLMIRFMIGLVIVIFAINALTKGQWMEALLFSLAVAVGLTPEMLPMIVTVNLSKGAIAMAKKLVIVKRLNSIQNLGAMDVLCTDKTGTLTLNRVVLEIYCDVIGRESQGVLRYAYLNSFYQTGLKNLLDKAILKHRKLFKEEQGRKVDEIPFDFSRRIMSVILDQGGRTQIITKGAPEEIFKRCRSFELDGRVWEMQELLLADLKEEYDELSAKGFRVLAVAYKDLDVKKEVYTKEDEKDLVLAGYLAFLDPPKPSVRRAVRALKKLGVEIKVLTGDHESVTQKICADVGLDVKEVVTGDTVGKMTEAELRRIVESATVFARLSPAQKERLIRLLQENGHTVGYLGDGINDALALKASDVGISVNNAVDVAKESAGLILLRKSLVVLEDGVLEGRKTFGNIVKYIKMGASSNFGNMISMTGASLLLPFLPMLPIQVLLNNLLYDFSQVSIPTDGVDKEYLIRPKPWDLRGIKQFMLIFGPISSIFDFITFAVLWFVFKASSDVSLFHTGWFLESLITQTLVIHIIRTDRIPFVESWASPWMILTSLLITGVGLLLPFSPLAKPLRFVRPPPLYLVFLVIVLGAYLALVYGVKRWLIRTYGDS